MIHRGIRVHWAALVCLLCLWGGPPTECRKNVTDKSDATTALQLPIPGIEAPNVFGVPENTSDTEVDPFALSRDCSTVVGLTKSNMLLWGFDYHKETPDECCRACKQLPACNIWKWCGLKKGCGVLFKHKECWLKYSPPNSENFSFVYFDNRSPGFITGFDIKEGDGPEQVAINLYYMKGINQRSVNQGQVVPDLHQQFAGGVFKFVTIADCAHLCELYRSRGCRGFHYTDSVFQGFDECMLVKNPSEETNSVQTTNMTTFFRNELFPRPEAVYGSERFLIDKHDGRSWTSREKSAMIPSGVDNSSLETKFVTMEICADHCRVEPECQAFTYKTADRGTCILLRNVVATIEESQDGWELYWKKGTEGSVKYAAVEVEEKKKAESHPPDVVWIILSVGIVAIVVILAIIAVLLYKRRTTVVVVNEGGAPIILAGNAPPLSEVDLNVDYDKIRMDRKKPLGVGAFGMVYRAVYKGKPVAVKILAPAFQVGPYLRSFQDEMKILSRVRHPNIVSCYGGNINPPKICIVEELMDKSLDDLLHGSEEPAPMTYLDVLHMANDVAAGLAHLHPHVVHRDLKPANILVDKNNTYKIADFGMSRMKASTYMTTEYAARGTIAYMAPECFLGLEGKHEMPRLTEKVDIYALALIILECVTGASPWRECVNHMVIISQVAYFENRPPIPEDVPAPLAELIRDCWDQKPHNRPSAQEVLGQTERILRRAKKETKSWRQTTHVIPTQTLSEALGSASTSSRDAEIVKMVMEGTISKLPPAEEGERGTAPKVLPSEEDAKDQSK